MQALAAEIASAGEPASVQPARRRRTRRPPRRPARRRARQRTRIPEARTVDRDGSLGASSRGFRSVHVRPGQVPSASRGGGSVKSKAEIRAHARGSVPELVPPGPDQRSVLTGRASVRARQAASGARRPARASSSPCFPHSRGDATHRRPTTARRLLSRRLARAPLSRAAGSLRLAKVVTAPVAQVRKFTRKGPPRAREDRPSRRTSRRRAGPRQRRERPGQVAPPSARCEAREHGARARAGQGRAGARRGKNISRPRRTRRPER